MNIDKIRERVKGIPHMTFSQAQIIRDVILKNQFQSLLELGFRHGVSTCYMAGALDDLGRGTILTIDLMNARKAEPCIDQLLADLGLTKYVTVIYEPTSYVWRLMKMLEENPSPRFDFCYIDGAHDWATDGFAFFLVDRLLQPGGLIIFDDLDWTYESSPALRNTERVRLMPQEEKSTPQVRKIYELLVKPHPAYGEFMVKDDWAYARRKSTQSNGVAKEISREVVYQREYVGFGGAILRIVRKLAG
jgi:predicted O-methyltransferase YrrM